MSRNIFIYTLFFSIMIFYLLYTFMIYDIKNVYFKHLLINLNVQSKIDDSVEYNRSIRYTDSNQFIIKESISTIHTISKQFIFTTTVPTTTPNLSKIQTKRSFESTTKLFPHISTNEIFNKTSNTIVTTKSVKVSIDGNKLNQTEVTNTLIINEAVKKSNITTETINTKTTKQFETTTESQKNSSNTLIDCPQYPPNLSGKYHVIESPIPLLSDLESEYKWLESGGHYSPPCKQNQSLAIIIPFRNRTSQLLLFLKNMHPFLKKQQLNYTIYVIDQNDTLPFNRGELMNVGYVEALKEYNFTCFIFHDVDLFPEDDRIIYNCTDTPRHMISGLDKWGYTLIYDDLFGGVVAINRTLFKKLNGFSNRYWGWGGEDDDLRSRLRFHNIPFVRYPKEIGRYKMLKHLNENPNPERFGLLRNNTAYFNKEGLATVDYLVKSRNKTLLYTRILVELKKNKLYRRKK